jgi:uncharacterized membrane protein
LKTVIFQKQGNSKMMIVAEKTSQVGLHMVVAFAVMYVFTGSIAYGGVAALIEPVAMVVIGPFHQRLWERIKEKRASTCAEPGNLRSCQG